MGKDLHQVADEVDALATEIATIVDHAVTEKRDLNRKERGRLRYITGRSRAISEELTDETDELERRGALGFDPRGARGGSGRSLGQFLAGEFRALAEGVPGSSSCRPTSPRRCGIDSQPRASV